MLKRIFCLAYLVLLIFHGFSQVDVSSVILPSPQTQEFEKYINYNVTLYNGVPEISIPLYTIHLKGLDIPISLSYHASGIKYHQNNGDVGVGWVLNPGYRVSRTIYGQADDRYDMPPSLGDSLSSHSGSVERDKFLSMFVGNSLGGNFPQPHNPLIHYDGEYDLFNYMLPTENGTFLITDRNNKFIQTMDESNVKINYSTGLSSNMRTEGILNFNLTDDQGNKYNFGERTEADANVFESVPNDASISSAWAMTNITTLLGDQLKFKYDTKEVNGWTTEYRQEKIVLSGRWSYYNQSTSDSYSDAGYQTFLLNEMSNDREKISIQRNYSGFVTQLSVHNSKNITIKTVSFYYSDHSIGYHTFLDSIQIKDRDSNAIQTYKFDYNLTNYPTSMGIDQWGYYLPGANPTDLHQEFSDMQIPNHLATDYVYMYFSGFANRKQNSTPSTYSLESITYPTGGKTEYEYESNCYQWSPGGPYIYGGGLRIKSIRSYDLTGTPTLVHEYTYGDNGCGIAKMNVDETYFEDQSIWISYDAHEDGYYEDINLAFSTSMKGDVGATGSTSSIVNYPKVTETLSNGFTANGKIVYNYNIGTEYEVGYLPGSGLSITDFNAQGPPYIMGYRYWDKPLPRETDYYSSNNELIKKDSFEYYTYVSFLTGLKVRLFATADVYNDLDYDIFTRYISSFFGYNPYTITYGKNLLTNKREILYHGDEAVVENTDYEYNPKRQLTKTTTYQSNGKKHYTYVNYPFDYASGSGFVDSMISRNIVAIPIEKVEANEDVSGNVHILNGVVSRFRPSNPALADTISVVEHAGPILLDNYKFSNRPVGVLPSGGTPSLFAPDISYKPKVIYNKYDNFNNLIQQEKVNDIVKSYLWDYQYDLPICEATNADSGSIAYTSFEADGFGNWTIGNTARLSGGVTGDSCYELSNGSISKSGLNSATKYILSYWTRNSSAISITGTVAGYPVKGRSVTISGYTWTYFEYKIAGQSSVTLAGTGYFDELRLYPADAQMTTYTYAPLVGMTSQCDINSRVTYYEYDGFSRLSLVRDQDRNVIKRICYNYAGQPESCVVPYVYLKIEYDNIRDTIEGGYWVEYGDVYFRTYDINGNPLVLQNSIGLNFATVRSFVDLDGTIIATQTDNYTAGIPSGSSSSLYYPQLQIKYYPVDGNGNQTGPRYEIQTVATPGPDYIVK